MRVSKFVPPAFVVGAGAAAVIGLGAGVAAADDGVSRSGSDSSASTSDRSAATQQTSGVSRNGDEAANDQPASSAPQRDREDDDASTASLSRTADAGSRTAVTTESDDLTSDLETVSSSVTSPPEPAPSSPPLPAPTAPPAALRFMTTSESTRRVVDSAPETAAPEEVPPPAATARLIGADTGGVFTGEPSLVHRAVVAALQVVDLVVKPFGGGILAFTGIKIPLVTDGAPPFFLTSGLDVERDEFEGMPVWTVAPPNPTGQYVVALHGGAYVAEASVFHWWLYTDIVRATGASVVVLDYPLVDEGGTAAVVVPATANLIEALIAEHGAENVSVLGDSAGGGIALPAVQELVRRGSPVPARMVLLAPWLDVTVSDPRSAEIDPRDPLLDIPNLREAGLKWTGTLSSEDVLVNPLNGSLDGLPPTAVYSGSLDLLSPDTLRLQQRVIDEGRTNFTFTLRRDLLHDWVIFGFLPEAQASRPDVYRQLVGRGPVEP